MGGHPTRSGVNRTYLAYGDEYWEHPPIQISGGGFVSGVNFNMNTRNEIPLLSLLWFMGPSISIPNRHSSKFFGYHII